MTMPSPSTENPGIDSPQPPRRLVRAIQRTVAALVFSYAVALTVLFLAMELIGERVWPLAVLLYLPQRIFLLPLVILIPASLLVDASAGVYAILAGSVIIFLWHVPFYPGLGAGERAVKIKVMTNNYGQNHGLKIQPFIDAEDPDFVALEDSPGQAPVFQRDNPRRSVLGEGQFMLMSKVPIESGTVLEWPLWRRGPIAAEYHVTWQGRKMAIYTVHMPTPRGDFAKLTGLGLIKELAGRNRRLSDEMSFAEAMTARVQLARNLSEVFAREKLPFVAMGDFNMPPDGYMHRVINSGLTDCFEEAGFGFGFTFPCDTHNPLTLGSPWLRLDYVLCGPGWQTQDCHLEPDRRSQHRAVVATLCRD